MGKDGSQPLVIVAASVGALPPGAERAAIARRALSQLKQIRDVAVDAAASETAGLVEWVRLEGTATDSATDSATGAPIRVIQVMRFEGAGYVRVIGLGQATDAALAQRTHRLASSITLR